jgi:OOP family OmpA-OmpF porin
MEGSQVVLDIAAETLLVNLEVLVRVEGYTDATGPAEYNRDLSRRRAEVVRDMLIKAGIEAERLRVVAHGEDQPLATNETADGRRINRRVQLVTEE